MRRYIGDDPVTKNHVRDRFAASSYVGSITPLTVFQRSRVITRLNDLEYARITAVASGGNMPVMPNPFYMKEPESSPRFEVPETIAQTIYFQYFPESITDTRSLPMKELKMFFISNAVPTISGSSSRNISFDLRFTREKWVRGQRLDPNDWDKYNVDVAMALQSLRSFVYPLDLAFNIGILPQAVRLTLPGTKIGIRCDTVVGLIVSYEAEYVAFFSDGQPRIANVSLEFVEYPILSWMRNIVRDNFQSVLEEFDIKMNRVKKINVSGGRSSP